MSRLADADAEVRESKRRDELIKVLEFGLVGVLEYQGIELVGFSVNYSAFSCLMTLKADVQGKRSVAFISSDTIGNCFLGAYSAAARSSLHWKADKYHKDNV